MIETLSAVVVVVGDRARRAVAPFGARVRGGALPADATPSVRDSAPAGIPMV